MKDVNPEAESVLDAVGVDEKPSNSAEKLSLPVVVERAGAEPNELPIGAVPMGGAVKVLLVAGAEEKLADSGATDGVEEKLDREGGDASTVTPKLKVSLVAGAGISSAPGGV